MKKTSFYVDLLIKFIGVALLIGIMFMPMFYYVSQIDNVTLCQTAFFPLTGEHQAYEHTLRVIYIIGMIIFLVSCFLNKKLMHVSFIIQTLVLVSSITIISYLFFNKSFAHIDALPSMLTFYIVTICLLGVYLITNLFNYIYKIKNN